MSIKRSLAVTALCCAFVFALGLSACGGSLSDGTASSVSSSTSPEASSSSAQTSTETSSAASTPSTSDVSSQVMTQGAPQITMGNLGLVSVHETDEGVGADVVIQVTNTGDVPIIMSNPYIKVADASGNVIVDEHGNGIFTGPSYLRVGDTGFIYTNGPLTLPSGYAPGNNYLAQGSADLAACKEVHEYPLSNLKISEDSRGVPMVTGTVTNDDAETALLIEITAVFIDNENQTLGVAGTIAVDVEPGASRDFEIDGYTLPVGCTMAVISNYDVIAVGAKH